MKELIQKRDEAIEQIQEILYDLQGQIEEYGCEMEAHVTTKHACPPRMLSRSLYTPGAPTTFAVKIPIRVP